MATGKGGQYEGRYSKIGRGGENELGGEGEGYKLVVQNHLRAQSTVDFTIPLTV